MQERQIRLTTALAAWLWVLGLGLVGIGIMTDRDGVPGLGVLSSMAATVIHVRGFFAAHSECLRDAFEMGRDHERSLRSIR